MSVRGYAEWNPNPEKRLWVQRTNAVLEEYEDEWPLTVRQIFYRLVAEYDYEKSERGYGQLTQIISRARRAGYIDWYAIRDGGLGSARGAIYYTDADDFYDSVKQAARSMRLDRQRGQGQVIELWCEAGGMLSILSGIARPYSARANTGGGYDSVTAKHDLAVRVRERARSGLKTLVLHVGDFDPSGEDMCAVLHEDTSFMVVSQVIGAAAKTARQEEGAETDFKNAPWGDWLERALADPDSRTDADDRRLAEWALGYFNVERVALTGQQVIDRQVITAPPKPSDARMEGFIERNQWVVAELGTTQITAQLEALTPPELRELVTQTIESHMDMDVYAEVLDEERQVQADLARRLS